MSASRWSISLLGLGPPAAWHGADLSHPRNLKMQQSGVSGQHRRGRSAIGSGVLLRVRASTSGRCGLRSWARFSHAARTKRGVLGPMHSTAGTNQCQQLFSVQHTFLAAPRPSEIDTIDHDHASIVNKCASTPRN